MDDKYWARAAMTVLFSLTIFITISLVILSFQILDRRKAERLKGITVHPPIVIDSE